MSLLTASAVRARAQKATTYTRDSATVLTERIKIQASVGKYDIFLSHAFDDKEIILGAALVLEDLGFSVYLDWRDDKALDRRSVSEHTANILRTRMKQSKCLFFATTDSASSSKWMPWELGFMDGYNSRAAILPIQNSSVGSYKGQEYLGIYPYIDQEKNRGGEEKLWIHKDESTYIVFDKWLIGASPVKETA